MRKIFNYLVILNLLGVILSGCENVTGPESNTKIGNMKSIHLEKTDSKDKSLNFRVYNLALKPIQMISIPINPPYKNTDPKEGMVIIKYDAATSIISYNLNAHNLISDGLYTIQLVGKEINEDINEAIAGSGGNLKITGEIKEMSIYSYHHFALQILDKSGKPKLRTDEIEL